MTSGYYLSWKFLQLLGCRHFKEFEVLRRETLFYGAPIPTPFRSMSESLEPDAALRSVLNFKFRKPKEKTSDRESGSF